MVKFLLWCILFVLCWPLALVALVFYRLVWILLLPFRLVGIAVGGVLELVGLSSSCPRGCSGRSELSPLPCVSQLRSAWVLYLGSLDILSDGCISVT